ncbi:hypothetical protein [Rhodopila sp.]|uniref:hypothetical protein n=1 Tax=Rhodopila sp. TaxID=2480087 RepID=UPI003D13CE44
MDAEKIVKHLKAALLETIDEHGPIYLPNRANWESVLVWLNVEFVKEVLATDL